MDKVKRIALYIRKEGFFWKVIREGEDYPQVLIEMPVEALKKLSSYLEDGDQLKVVMGKNYCIVYTITFLSRLQMRRMVNILSYADYYKGVSVS